MQQNSNPGAMTTLADCINKLTLDGYDENFKVAEGGLLALHKEKVYRPEDITSVNFYRFEGASDPADNSVLYAIVTEDGIKGTLTDAYGPYSDPLVTQFMEEVNQLEKKPVHH